MTIVRHDAVLDICLTGSGCRRPDTCLNRIAGGPETLLGWIETQIGFRAPLPSHAERVLEYAAALDNAGESIFSASLKLDRWGTASELLARRDELRMAGWDEKDTPKLPSLARDMARAVKGRVLLPDMRDRINEAIAALDRGQKLPPHQCVLWDAEDRWPAAWRPLLKHLFLVNPPEREPAAPSKTALAVVQRQTLRGDVAMATPDKSLRWLQARSDQTACEAVAKALAADPSSVRNTVILCENDAVAVCLDSCLASVGLPTMGASISSHAYPALQVLPLALRLCWEPVDVQTLLDFLALPVNPIPRKTANRLLDALSEEPGIGGQKWREAVAEATLKENDPDGRSRDRIREWMDIRRVKLGMPLPADLVAEVCNRVSQWAGGRAVVTGRDGDDGEASAHALRLAASQAATMKELALGFGQPLSESQLGRLLEAAQEEGVTTRLHPEAAGGPVRARSLVEILTPCVRLVWIGLGTSDPVFCRWTSLELQTLRKAGVDIDDGSAKLASWRASERRGFGMISGSLLAMTLPGDAETRLHPLWLQIQGALRGESGESPAGPVSLSDLFMDKVGDRVSPWSFPNERSSILPPQPQRLLWKIPKGLLKDRAKTSAGCLETRLACPLKWVMTYSAKIRSSAVAGLPDEFLLKGTFCHSVLETVFDERETLPDPDEAARLIARQFDEKLPREAAILAQPSRAGEMELVKRHLMASGRKLVEVLKAGGYRIEKMEMQTGGNVDGVPLETYVDCLARRPDGQEAVIDFKFGGARKRSTLLKENRALQLAVYAHARSQACGGRFPAVAYLILDDAALFMPEGSKIIGGGAADVVPGAASIQEVFANFIDALHKANGWMTCTEPIPARPLQLPDERAPGSDMAIAEPDYGKTRADADPCKYCDYKILCGLEDLA